MSDLLARSRKLWPSRWRWPWRLWHWCLWWGRCTPAVIAVRHADVDPASGVDPPLNVAGEVRAEALRHGLSDAGIAAIFVTSWQRTQLTAQPLATALGLVPIVENDVAATIAAVRSRPSHQTVLLVGHTNTVPDLITGLGGSPITPIASTEFDRLLALARGRLVTLRYGAQRSPRRGSSGSGTYGRFRPERHGSSVGMTMKRTSKAHASGPSTQGRSSPASEMRAVVQDRYGAAGVLHPARIARPVAGDQEVLVRVHAAGLDRGTWHLMTGKPYLMRIAGLGFRGPKDRVPGRDLAGTVAAVGTGVTQFAVGDEVYGVGRGSFAEYASARADKLARKPSSLSFEEAAVVPISAATALQALTDHGRLEPGQRVLVIGASGGVGSYAVQIAKALGAGSVTGVASTAKLDLVRSLGADHVIDYTRDDFAATGQRYDLVLDIAGNPGLRRLRRALTPTGTAVIVGGEDGGDLTGGMSRTLRALVLSRVTKQRFANFINKERASDLDRLTALIDAGQVIPSIDRTYPLGQVPDAMRQLSSGQVRGKVAITI